MRSAQRSLPSSLRRLGGKFSRAVTSDTAHRRDVPTEGRRWQQGIFQVHLILSRSQHPMLKTPRKIQGNVPPTFRCALATCAHVEGPRPKCSLSHPRRNYRLDYELTTASNNCFKIPRSGTDPRRYAQRSKRLLKNGVEAALHRQPVLATLDLWRGKPCLRQAGRRYWESNAFFQQPAKPHENTRPRTSRLCTSPWLYTSV